MTVNGDVADDVRRARPSEGEVDDFFRRLAIAARRDPAPRALHDLAAAAHRLILRHAPPAHLTGGSTGRRRYAPEADHPAGVVGHGPDAGHPEGGESDAGHPVGGGKGAAGTAGRAPGETGPPGPAGNGHSDRPRLPNGRYAPVPAPDMAAEAVMEHLGHLAAEAATDLDALVPAGALVPLALPPGRAPDAVPDLLAATAALTRGLHADPAIRPLIRLVPGLLRTALGAADRSGPVEAFATEARRVLADPLACVAGYDRSAAADRLFHAGGVRP